MQMQGTSSAQGLLVMSPACGLIQARPSLPLHLMHHQAVLQPRPSFAWGSWFNLCRHCSGSQHGGFSGRCGRRRACRIEAAVDAGQRLLSMPDNVHHKIVSELTMQLEWGCVQGLAALALVCKRMQRVANSYVTVLREPQEVHLDAHAAMTRWPHARKAQLRSTHQAAQLLAVLPQLS
jgi:hypothetical protein